MCQKCQSDDFRNPGVTGLNLKFQLMNGSSEISRRKIRARQVAHTYKLSTVALFSAKVFFSLRRFYVQLSIRISVARLFFI
jgi:hypothetical protein